MAIENWRAFLQSFSAALLSDSKIYGTLPPNVIQSGWMGYDGTSPAELANLEQCLGRTLPPSYRNFLQASNGWRNTGPFIKRVWPADRVTWFRERHQDLIDAHTVGGAGSVSDAEYFQYGPEQDPALIRVEYLTQMVEISEMSDSAIYLLNPTVATPEGEWETWFLADWLPGAVRYRSFAELMQAEYNSLLRSRTP